MEMQEEGEGAGGEGRKKKERRRVGRKKKVKREGTEGRGREGGRERELFAKTATVILFPPPTPPCIFPPRGGISRGRDHLSQAGLATRSDH